MLPRVSKVQGIDIEYLLFCTKDYISNFIFQHGKWEDHLKMITKLFIDDEEKPIVLDIGANLGGYCLPISKDLINRGGKVYAFEPQRIVFYQLCGNIIINRLDNLFAYNFAIGDKNESLQIPESNFDTSENIGAFSIIPKYRNHQGTTSFYKNETTLVDCLKLDDIEFGGNVSFIKIDVEGYEINVLRGGAKFFEKNNFPPFIFEAWDNEWFKKDKCDLLNFVNELGYELFNFDGTNYLAQHRSHHKFIEFSRNENGSINFKRLK